MLILSKKLRKMLELKQRATDRCIRNKLKNVKISGNYMVRVKFKNSIMFEAFLRFGNLLPPPVYFSINYSDICVDFRNDESML